MFLHGHQLERNLARAVTAEAVGTFVLVLAITSTAVAAALSRPVAGAPYGSLAVPVAGGLALAIAVASLGHISGAHLNPAVTLGLAVSRRFPWACAPGYVLAQFAGAIAAAAVTWGLYGNQARVDRPPWRHRPGRRGFRGAGARGRSRCHLRPGPGGRRGGHRQPGSAWHRRHGHRRGPRGRHRDHRAGQRRGRQPARAIGPMILAGQFPDWWAYLAAPLAGGVVAVALYDRFLRAGRTPA